MSHLLREVRHFVLRDGIVADHTAIADEMVRLAKGDHTVSLALPGGEVTATPEDDRAMVAGRIGNTMAPAAKDEPEANKFPPAAPAPQKGDDDDDHREPWQDERAPRNTRPAEDEDRPRGRRTTP